MASFHSFAARLEAMLYSAGSILRHGKQATCDTRSLVVRSCCLMIRCLQTFCTAGIPDSTATGRCCSIHAQDVARMP
jgi:hypothetical protein